MWSDLLGCFRARDRRRSERGEKGIALLVTLLIRTKSSGRRVLAYGLCEHFRDIFSITRLSDHIALYEDEESALAGIAPVERAATSGLGLENTGKDTGVPAPV